MASRTCQRPGYGWTLDAADEKYCGFCTGKLRVCACKFTDEAGAVGHPTVPGNDPCPRCGGFDHLPSAQLAPMRN